jgi:hypothetical protein
MSPSTKTPMTPHAFHNVICIADNKPWAPPYQGPKESKLCPATRECAHHRLSARRARAGWSRPGGARIRERHSALDGRRAQIGPKAGKEGSEEAEAMTDTIALYRAAYDVERDMQVSMA